MDDIKLFSKNEKEQETLIHTVRIYSQEIGMEFGIEKCALFGMKSGKRHLTDGIQLPNQDKIKSHAENERDIQILRNLGGWHHQTSRNEKQNSKRISQED